MTIRMGIFPCKLRVCSVYQPEANSVCIGDFEFGFKEGAGFAVYKFKGGHVAFGSGKFINEAVVVPRFIFDEEADEVIHVTLTT